METFLAGWRSGKPKLPAIKYTKGDDLDEPARELDRALDSLKSLADPVAEFLRNTAESYLVLCDLLMQVGKPGVLKPSRALYGVPSDVLSEGSVSNLEAAEYFLEQSAQFGEAAHLQEADYCVPAEVVKSGLEARLADVFPEKTVDVVIDPNMASHDHQLSTQFDKHDDITVAIMHCGRQQVLQRQASCRITPTLLAGQPPQWA